MRRFVVAACAAVLVLMPTAATTQGALLNGELPALADPAPAPNAQAPDAAQLRLPAADLDLDRDVAALPEHDHESAHSEVSGLAPGQSKADYQAWLARSPVNAARVRAFRDHLAAQGVEDIVPVWQLIRTSSSWRECGADRFEVAPADKWDNIVRTLAFVRDEVQPKIGDVEALSVYRNESLNRCSHGAPASAHRLFFALDLTPLNANVSRASMIRGICAAHATHGRDYDTGLGFYTGKRFHVDSSGFRKWGPNGKGATSPCVTGSYA